MKPLYLIAAVVLVALGVQAPARAEAGFKISNRSESYLYFTRGGSTYTSFLLKQENAFNLDPWGFETGFNFRKGYGAFDGIKYTAEERGDLKAKALYRFDPRWSLFYSFTLAGNALENTYRTYGNEAGLRNFNKNGDLYYIAELAYRRENYDALLGSEKPKDFLATFFEVGVSIAEASRFRAWGVYRPRFGDWGDYQVFVEPGVDLFFSKTFYFRSALLYSYRSVKTWDGDRRWDAYGHFGLGFEHQ